LPVLVARTVTWVFPGTVEVEDELPPHPVVKAAVRAIQDAHSKRKIGR
jgi:hypothetical protein